MVIYLDHGVLDPVFFRSLLFSNPNMEEQIDSERGKAKMRDMDGVLTAVAAQVDMVGVGFAEYMPRDALYPQEMLTGLPSMR